MNATGNDQFANVVADDMGAAMMSDDELYEACRTSGRRATKPRAKNFTGDSVELDAVHPDQLRALVEDHILEHLPDDQMRVLRVAEESERGMLQMFARDVAR